MKKTATNKTDYVFPELKVVSLSVGDVITTSGEPNLKGLDNGKKLDIFDDYVGGAF